MAASNPSPLAKYKLVGCLKLASLLLGAEHGPEQEQQLILRVHPPTGLSGRSVCRQDKYNHQVYV
jgi:hypothetical protein